MLWPLSIFAGRPAEAYTCILPLEEEEEEEEEEEGEKEEEGVEAEVEGEEKTREE